LRSENCLAPSSSRIALLLIPSAIGIATGYGLDDKGVRVRVPVGVKIVSSPRCPDRFWSSLSLLSSRYWEALSPGIKSPGSEVKTLTSN
jgi:hypothetical protein